MKKTGFFLLGIVVLAAFLRFYKIETKMRFIWDEGRDMTAIHRIVAQRDLTLFGPYNEMDGHQDFFGVFHYYLMAPSLWLANFDPIGPAIFTALLGVASVYLSFILVKQWTDENIALLAALFYAISPLVIKFVQWPWNPNTTPFFSLLYWGALTHFLKNKTWQKSIVGVAGLLLGILFQLHYFTIALGLPFILILLNKIKQNQQRFLLLVIFTSGFILANLNFIIFDLTHQFFYWKIIKQSFIGSSPQNFFVFNPLALLITPFVFTQQTLQQLGLGLFFGYIFTPVIFFFGYENLIRFYQTKKIDLGFLVTITIGLFLVMTSFFPSLSDLYHLAYLWWGIWFMILFELRKMLKKEMFEVVVLTMFILVGFNAIQLIKLPPDWSQNLPLVRSVSQLISDDLEKNPSDNFNLAAFTDADTRATRYRYFLQKNGFEAAGVDQYPHNQVIYIITPHDENITKQNPAWELASTKELSWQLLGQQDDIFVFKAEK